MPELPDVEVFKRYFENTSLYQEIAGLDIIESRMLKQISEKALKTQLEAKQFTGAMRHGKFMFANSDDGALVLHFGMTGYLKYYRDDREAPSHTRLLVRFNGNAKLAVSDQRKLGRISFTDDIQRYVEQQHLGPDAFSDDFNVDSFKQAINSSGGSIKSALMNQERIAGIGNIYSDEILFQARLKPGTSTRNLDDKKQGFVQCSEKHSENGHRK